MRSEGVPCRWAAVSGTSETHIVPAARSKPAPVQPYEGLAEIYDFVMRHVNYRLWAMYVMDLFRRYRFSPHTVLDLACGTGSLSLRLHQHGYKVCGADASPAMLTVARRKAKALSADIPFWETRLPAVRAPGRFDAVLCLYDSINYLLNMDHVRQTLDNVYAVLAADVRSGARGLFVFDICTEANSLRNFRDYTESQRGRGFSYTRRSVYAPHDRLQTNEFEIRFRGGGTVVEKHAQRVYALGEMLDAIHASPFELLGAFSGFTFSEATETSERIHFVLR